MPWPEQSAETFVDGREGVRRWLVGRVAGVLEIDPSTVDVTARLEDLDIDSVLVALIRVDLEEWLGREVPYSIFADYGSINELAVALSVSS